MNQFWRGILCALMLTSSGVTLSDSCCDNGSSTNGCCDTSSSCCPSSSDCCDNNNSNNCGGVFGKTYYAYRPQDWNKARQMMGTSDKIHLYGKECFYGTASVALEYTQTFNANDLSKWFLFNGKCSMTYGIPSACQYSASSESTFDVNAVNFGSTNSGVICVKPRISNFIADIDLFLGWDEFICGLWTRLDIPINYTRWNLRFRNSIAGQGAANFPVDWVTPDATAAVATEFINGSFGDAPALKCGKWSRCSKSTTQVAGVHLDVGYDFLRKECGYLGLALHLGFPTGTKPCSSFLFAPVSGANHSWQLGGTLVAGFNAWQDCDSDNSLAFYLDASLVHLFKAKQQRLLGLRVNGQPSPGASWLLLKKFDENGTYSTLERAANILCCQVKVGNAALFDGALMMQYDWCNFSFALGYEFWGRSKEKLCGNCCAIPANTYGIKGGLLVGGDEADLTSSTSTIATCAAADGVTSASNVYLTNADINPCVALHPSAYSNKLFAYVGYSWRDCEWQPYFGIGGEVEFGGSRNKAVDQWGVLAKLGVAF